MKVCVLVVVLAVTSIQLIWADIDKSVCKPASKPVFPPPPALTTTKLLSLKVEWRETVSKKTFNVQESYDEERNLGALYIKTPPQQDIKIIFDLSKDVALVVRLPSVQSDATTCRVMNMGTQMFRYDNKPWLTSLMFLYRSMLQTRDTEFVANSTVKTIRSYPVQEWRACMYDFYIDLTTQLRLFFTDIGSGWMTPHLPPSDPMLVSLMMHSKRHENTSTEEFNVVGDVVDFTPFPVFAQDTFMVPPGVYCPGRPFGEPLPIISEYFYMLMEVVDSSSITFSEIWYDHKAQRIRQDTKSAHGNDPNPKSTVYNFDTGVRYEKDMYLGTCNVETIQAGDDFTTITADNFIAMQNVSEVFHFQTATIQYSGEITVRGVLCNVWIGVYFDTNSNINSTVQWYFTKRTWKEAVDTVVVPGSFFRMDVWQGGSTKPVIYNIHKYTPVAQHWSVFDYGNCYGVNNRLHFVIQLLALDNFTMNDISQPYLYDMMQEELASLIYEEPNRLSNILIEYDGGLSLYVSGLLLDKTPVSNYQMAKKVVQHPLIPAFSFLKGTVETQNVILVTNIQGFPVRLQTRRMEQISYPDDFTTFSTQSTPTTVFRIPTIPRKGPTLPRTPPLGTPTPLPPTSAVTATSRQPFSSHVTSSKTTETNEPPILPWTPVQTPKPTGATPKSTVRFRCPTCTCPKILCPSSPVFQCPTVTPQSTAAPVREVCPTQRLQLQISTEDSGISGGALAAGVIVSLVLGAVLCFLVLVLVSRHRDLPLLQHRHEDTETIPLGNY